MRPAVEEGPAADAALTPEHAELEKLTQMLYQMPVGVVRCTLPAGRVELMNPLLVQLAAELLPQWTSDSVFDLLAPCFPDLRALVSDFQAPHGLIFENRRVHLGSPRRDGLPTWLSVTALRVDEQEFVLVVNDISREVAREHEIRQAGAWISALVRSSGSHMACLLDGQGLITRWTPYAEQLTGCPADEVVGRHVGRLFADEADAPEQQRLTAARLERAREAGWDLQDGWMRRRGGQAFFASSIVTLLDQADARGSFALVARDMTDQREAVESLRRLTVSDYLTGASNRAYLHTVGRDEAERCAAQGLPLSVVVMDADRFKAVNDTHGHDAGDEVLRHLVRTCQRQLRASDLLARLGGEEFVALLPGCDAVRAQRLAERMRAALAQTPAPVGDGVLLAVTASFGVATGQGPQLSLETLLRQADHALYAAKAAGRNCVRRHADLDTAAPSPSMPQG